MVPTARLTITDTLEEKPANRDVQHAVEPDRRLGGGVRIGVEVDPGVAAGVLVADLTRPGELRLADEGELLVAARLRVGVDEPQVEPVAEAAPKVQDVVGELARRAGVAVVEDEQVLARAAGLDVAPAPARETVVARAALEDVVGRGVGDVPGTP